MDSETNSEVSSNGIKTSKNSIQNGIKSGGNKGTDSESDTKQLNPVNGESQINGNETEKDCQIKGESNKSGGKTGSRNSSVDKSKFEKSNSTDEDNTDKKAGGKSSRLNSFAAPTKSSQAKAASKTPEGKKQATGQDTAKDTTVSEKKTPVNKKKGFVETVREKFGPTDQGKPKQKPQEKSELEKGKQNTRTTTESKAKAESKPKQTEKVGENTSKVGTKKYQKSNKKRIIGSEKSTLEVEDLCYLNFDFCEDYTCRRYTMAQAQMDPVQETQKDNTEYVYVTDNKLKYIKKDFQNDQAKINDRKCDVKLKVADQSFDAHWDVLMGASDYFSDMKAKGAKGQEVIEMKDISPKGFSAMLDYFYHGHVTIDPDNIEDVLEAARFFKNDWLLEICCDFLVRHLSLENYTAVIQLMDKYYLGDLRWDIFVFLGQNLPDLVQKEKFYQNLQMELILQFLMENVYVEASEMFILEFILKWVQEDTDKRQEHLLSLLRQVRFPVMEAEELESLPDEVMKFPEMKQLVENAMNYNCNIMGQCLTNEESYEPRGARQVVSVMSFNLDYNMVAYRDPDRQGFFVEELGPTGLDIPYYQAMMQTSIGNFLYAVGGYDGNCSSVARVFRFNPKYRDWLEVSPMNRPRVNFAICSSAKNMYVFGGVNHQHTEDGGDTEDILAEVEVFDPQENKWDDLLPLPKKCYDQAAAYCEGCLYVTGGVSEDPLDPVPLDSVWCLNLTEGNEWVSKQSMSKQRKGHSMSVFNGKIYVVGGFTESSYGSVTSQDCIDNEVFDVETGQWSSLAPTPAEFGHLFPTVGLCNHKIFALGGNAVNSVFSFSGNNVNSVLYVYDIDTDSWEEKEMVGPNVQKLAILSVAYPHS